MSAASIMVMPVRRAQVTDVDKADLSYIARSVYRLRCNHINAANESWLKKETEASKLNLSIRSIVRARNELVEKGYACFPEGDSGGRAQSKEEWPKPRGAGLVMRLHPDGCCRCPKVELKQRSSATKPKSVPVALEVVKGDSLSPLYTQPKGDCESVKGDCESKKPRVYKEGTLSIRTLSTTAAPEQPKTSETLVAAAASLCGEKFSQASSQKNSSSSTTAVETITNHPTPYDPPPPLPSAALPEAVQACATRIYENHPLQRRDISLAKVGRRITEILRYRKLAGEPALAYLGVLADRHGAWCRYGEWRKENGRFAKGLNRWLAPGEELYEIDSPEQAIPATPEPRGLQLEEIK